MQSLIIYLFARFRRQGPDFPVRPIASAGGRRGIGRGRGRRRRRRERQEEEQRRDGSSGGGGGGRHARVLQGQGEEEDGVAGGEGQPQGGPARHHPGLAHKIFPKKQ